MDNLEKNIVMVLARFMDAAGVSFLADRIVGLVARRPGYPGLLGFLECLRGRGLRETGCGVCADLSGVVI